jgi:hypothetical protein
MRGVQNVKNPFVKKPEKTLCNEKCPWQIIMIKKVNFTLGKKIKFFKRVDGQKNTRT